MKNLFRLVCILAVFAGSFVFGQKYINENAEELISSVNGSTGKKRLIMCVTYSCCTIGDFGVDVFSHKSCDYIVTGKNKMVILDVVDIKGNPYQKNEVEVVNDIVLPDENTKSGENEGFVMKAGLYKVINGQIAFEPSAGKLHYVCYTSEHEGTLFGHHYSYSISHCLVYPWVNKSNDIKGGIAIIDISSDATLVRLAKENNNVLRFDEDVVLQDNIVLEAGEYIVNENLKIYTRKFYIK
jgi:hypothetical protein